LKYPWGLLLKVLGEEAFYATCASIGVHVSLSEIDRVCQLAFRSGTANVHLKAGQPPILCVDGELQIVESAPLTPDLLVERCTPRLGDRHKEEFLECAVPTFAHLIILKEQQHRFRVNLLPAERKYVVRCTVRRSDRASIGKLESATGHGADL